MNASTDGALLKGYVAATSEGTEIGVIEGGSLLISSSGGEKLVQAGNRINVAQNTDQGAASGASGPKKSDANPEKTKRKTIIVGLIGAAEAATIVGLSLASRYKDDDKASPSSP